MNAPTTYPVRLSPVACNRRHVGSFRAQVPGTLPLLGGAT